MYTSHRTNKTKDNEPNSMNERNILLYKNISLILFLKWTQIVVSLRDRWRDIYSERGLLLAPYLFPGTRECQHLHPPCRPYRQTRQRCPWSDAYPWLDSRFWLSKSDCVILISHGPLPAKYLLDRPILIHWHPPVY